MQSVTRVNYPGHCEQCNNRQSCDKDPHDDASLGVIHFIPFRGTAGTRTPALLYAVQVRYQLRYSPMSPQDRFDTAISALSGRRLHLDQPGIGELRGGFGTAIPPR